MTRPKRFRGMELTEEHATQSAYGYIFDNYQTVPPYRASRYANIVNRAKRLLPLWRKWGLQALYNHGHRAACEGYEYMHRSIKRCEELDQ